MNELVNTSAIPAQYGHTADALRELAAASAGLATNGPEDKPALAAVTQARIVLKNTRVEIEKRRKELKADALKYGQQVDAAARELKAVIEPEEERLKSEEKRVADEIARREREAYEARATRLRDIGANDWFPAVVQDMTDEAFEEFLTAEAERIEVETERARVEEEAKRAEAAKIEAESKRLAEERAAFEAEQAKAREEQERLAEERRKVEAERQAVEAEKRRAVEEAERAERMKEEAAERAEREKAYEESRKKRLAEELAEREQREAALKAEEARRVSARDAEAIDRMLEAADGVEITGEWVAEYRASLVASEEV